MIGRTNAGGLGTSLSLTVSVSAGSVVTATSGERSVTGTSVGGVVKLKLPAAGEWSVSATNDGQTTNTKVITVTDSYSVELSYFSADITVTVPSGATVTCSNGNTTYNGTSNGTVVFTVNEPGTWTITASNGTQTTTKDVAVSTATGYSVTLAFIVSTLNDNSWETIAYASNQGIGDTYWDVGDTKTITINGKAGATTFSSLSVDAFIIGFNHNSTKEGANRIHFQIGKISGEDVCLCDSNHNSNTTTSGAFTMNTSYTNSGGWNNSHMRKTVLGSNATPTSPTANTLLACLPSDLRAVMKSVTKYSDNTGGGSNTASYVTATTDYLWLLSEYEVQGARSRANSAEQNYQAQYDYYKAGNSKVKYKHNATGTAAIWWLRSVDADGGNCFCLVNTGGSANNNTAYNSYGVAPGFAA